MGPQAGLDLCNTIIKNTDAKHDQEHVPFVLYNLPQIPDRVGALLGHEDATNPVPRLIDAVRTVEKAGADFTILACNTAHGFINEVRKKTKRPVLDMVKLTWEYIHENYPNAKRIGVLGTNGLVKTRIYDKYSLEKRAIYPEGKDQEKIAQAILDIKAGKNLDIVSKDVLKVTSNFRGQGIEHIILACTEFPLLQLDEKVEDINLVNPTEIVAKEAVKLAKGKKYSTHANLLKPLVDWA